MLKLPIHSSLAAIALCLAAEGATAAPVVSVDAPQSVTSISREQLDSLPAGRRVEDLIKTCPAQTFPTVTRDRQMLVDGQPISSSLSLNCLVPTDVEMIEVYQVHNAARAEYGAPPLVRDPALELSAGEYVGQLARTGKLVHAPRAGRGNIRENISQGLPSWSARQLIGGWLKEKQNFVPGTFPNVSRTGNWYDIGHWAQMIWIQTVVIGCARAAGIGATWMVCRYGPGGNKDGQLVGVPQTTNLATVDSKIEQPTLPDKEVFTANADQVAGSSPQGFLQYSTDAFTAALFGMTGDDPADAIDDEFWASSIGVIANLSEDTRLELGTSYEDYDFTGAPLPGGIYWDPISQVTIGVGANYVDGADYVDSVKPPQCVDDDYKAAIDALRNYDEAKKAGDKDGMDKAKADLAAALAEQRKLAADPTEAKIFEIMKDAYEDITGEKAPAGGTAEIDTPTDVQQPGLPPKEVFNPADLPKCTLEIM